MMAWDFSLQMRWREAVFNMTTQKEKEINNMSKEERVDYIMEKLIWALNELKKDGDNRPISKILEVD